MDKNERQNGGYQEPTIEIEKIENVYSMKEGHKNYSKHENNPGQSKKN